MLFDLPDDTTLYAALVARDTTWDGRAWVGVRTTGILCRLSCPARNPKPENCTFYDSAGAGLAAGHRPCKRCNPLGAQPPEIQTLLDALDAQPEKRWREADLRALGHDPATLRRIFQRQFGMTFLDMARQRRLSFGLDALAKGERVIDAQIASGFDSPSAFRDAISRLLGCPPGALKTDAPLRAHWIPTPLGPLIAVATAHALMMLEFQERKALPRALQRLTAKTGLALGRFSPIDQTERQLEAFFEGRSATFTVPLAPQATPFTQSVWSELRKIPAGDTRTYAQIAQALGRPTATRAVAQANGANPIALVVPCHRVIGTNGALTGYGGGLWRKDRLLQIETQYRRDTHAP